MIAPPRSSGLDTGTFLHELAQPLSAVLNNAQAAKRFLAMEAPDVVEARSAVNDIITQSKQAARILRRLEAYLVRGPNESAE